MVGVYSADEVPMFAVKCALENVRLESSLNAPKAKTSANLIFFECYSVSKAMKGLALALGFAEASKFKAGESEFGVIRENQQNTFGYSGNLFKETLRS